MKTTLDISDHLLGRAKAVAKKRGVTLRSLTEQGLALVLAAEEKKQPARIRPVTFSGSGLAAEFQNASWPQIRDAAYGNPSTS